MKLSFPKKRWLKIAIICAIVVLIVVAAAAWQLLHSMSTRLKLINSSPIIAKEVKIKLEYGSGTNSHFVQHDSLDLLPNEIRELRLPEGDSILSIAYSQNGKNHEVKCGYVANAGETYRLLIKGNGKESECEIENASSKVQEIASPQ